jgi:hypothetical protein
MEARGIFISHITEENSVALLLKDFLKKALGENLPIFVSSDYESISGGDVWFTTIVAGIKTSAVVLVLLSPQSLERRWINFEAGVGVGAGSTVIPVVIHGLQRSEVGHPLSSLQIRSLHTLEDVHALLRDVGGKIGRLAKVFVDATPLIADATLTPPGSGWVGIDWNGTYLAVDGPVMKLPILESQTYLEPMSDALKRAGFATRLANRNHIGPTLGAGYKKVFMTDRKSYRAEIVSYDTVLTAKLENRTS